MKIQSKWRDYYDHLTKFGVDPTVIYRRGPLSPDSASGSIDFEIDFQPQFTLGTTKRPDDFSFQAECSSGWYQQLLAGVCRTTRLGCGSH